MGWDPRGTNDSTPVKCFTSKAAEDQFWAGQTVPTTPADSAALQRKDVELARRCGEVSGDLLSHITTPDTARDLDALRRLVGDRKLTYVGFSYGSMIGQTYANLFPGRVRAMMLDGIIDAVEFTTSSEARTVDDVSSADEVFQQFIAACQDAAPGRCARRSRRDGRAADGGALGQGAPGADPGARGEPARRAHLRGPAGLNVHPLRLPLTWPQFATDLEAAVEGDASALETSARAMLTPEGWMGAVTSAAISCGDGPAGLPSSAGPQAIARFDQSGQLWGRCWAGGCGHRAPRTGRRTAPTGTRGRGTPGRRRRSC